MMTDRNLAKTLSARCYQPARFVGRSGPQQALNDQLEATEDATGGSEPTPRGESETMAQPTGPKKRGRPRLQPEASSQNRRAQIRRAQRTYRLKKEAMLRDMTSRVTELEETMDRISASLASLYDTAVQSELSASHPALFMQLQKMIDQFRPDSTAAPQQATVQSHTTRMHSESSSTPCRGDQAEPSPFGLLLDTSMQADEEDDHETTPAPRTPPEQLPPCIIPQQVERPLKGTATQTYSFSEADLSRKLHRYCLEHIYRVLTDPRCDPRVFYRVFRLVPCIRYKDKMIPYMKCLVRAGPNEDLEITAVPFYCIGGAGTHYPRTGEDGQPVYPENMRLPRKILGTVPGDLAGEGTSDREMLLKVHGFDGVWLDCHDIQGYLQEKGLVFDSASCVYAHGMIALPGQDKSAPGDNAADSSVPDSAQGLLNGTSLSGKHQPPRIGRGLTWILNIESFFQMLLQNMVVLGRAPGFRLRDVEAAFKSSVRIEICV